jgi:hypothetical protein
MRGKRGPRDVNKKTVPQLQNTLWPLFAEYIKRNYAESDLCRCFTCNKVIRVGDRDCQAGHFIPRTKSPTKYDERNVRPQCSRCNEYGGGEWVEFERRLKDEIGRDAVEELKEESRKPWKWDRSYLIEKIEYYKTELAEMR